MASQGRVVPGVRVAMEKFKQSISEDDAKRIESTGLQDVWDAIRDIGIEQRVQSTHILSRIGSIIRVIGKYSMDGGLFYAMVPYLAYIWAPIKFALQVASKYNDILEALLSAYTNIGAALPDLAPNIASNQTAFQYILGSICSGILEFHHVTWNIFRRVHWHQLFYVLWKGATPKIESIAGSLKLQGDVLNSMSTAASSGLELRGTIDHEAERRRHRQSHVQPAEDPVEPGPFHNFEILETENDMAEAGTLHEAVKYAMASIFSGWLLSLAV